MKKQRKLTIQMDEDLYNAAMRKSKDELCVPLATLVKIFLKSFTTQRGVGFFVGDADLANLIKRWMNWQKFQNDRGKRINIPGQVRLKDIFDLSDT